MASIQDMGHGAVEQMSNTPRHRFLTMIVGAILVAVFLVSVSMNLYNYSGAAQLDLSRPGYQNIRDQAKRETTTKTFSSTGELDEKAVKDFNEMYNERLNKVKNTTSFNSKPLTDESLQMFGTTTDAATAAPAQ